MIPPVVGSKGATLGAVAAAVAGIAVVATTSLASCSQTPTPVAVQTFDRPQDVDVVCMQVNNGNVNDFLSVIPPVPLPQSACTQVQTANTVPNILPNHLFALVTQTARGQVAVVDLTAGFVVDENSSTPGINLLPVGSIPSDIASAPDGKMSYVGSADPNAPAIFALPSTIILGDEEIANVTSGTNPQPNNPNAVIANLTTWPVCSLPQVPGAIAVLPLNVTSLADGGVTDLSQARMAPAVDDAGDAAIATSDDAGTDAASATDAGELVDAGDSGGAGADAGDAGDAGVSAVATGSGPGYVLAVVLPGDSAHPARVGIIDPSPLIRGASQINGGGDWVPDSGVSADGPVDPPGQLVPCTFVSYLELAAPAAGTTWSPGPAWQDGVEWVDGGQPGDQPQSAQTCTATADAGLGSATGATVAGLGGAPFAGYAALDTGGSRPIYYVADSVLPIIHVIDVSDPNRVVELPPLLATSVDQPQRPVTVGQLAVSPTTHDYRRFLYAVDVVPGTIMVYDVTDPLNGPHVPMLRPHPELDPFQPSDRIAFAQPVATVAFAQHDWPIYPYNSGEPWSYTPPAGSTAQAITGAICNPNPHVDLSQGSNTDLGPFSDPGAYYRYNTGTGIQGNALDLGPARLRGVFGFATLTNGSVETIDVDDWDAPCRRPDPMAPVGASFQDLSHLSPSPLLEGPYNGITPPQPDLGDTDPYHTPFAYQSWNQGSPVSLEAFYPVSAPHSERSFYTLTNDPVNGDHVPGFTSPPQLYLQGALLSTQSATGSYNPNLVPTDTPYVDYSLQSNPTTADPSARTFTISAAAAQAVPDAGTDASTTTADASAPDASAVTTNAAGTFVVSSPREQSFPIAPPNVRFSFENPRAYTDQSWSVTYEGQLPGFFDSGNDPLVVGDLASTDNWYTLNVTNETAGFCGKGIEDYAVGTQRAQATLAALAAAGLPTIPRLDHRTADYVQFTDDLPDVTDPYWQLADANQCWAGLGSQYEPQAPTATSPGQSVAQTATNRLAVCDATFGHLFDPNNPSTQRDFPILEAHDDHLVLGRFASFPDDPTRAREVVVSDPSNVPFLKLAQCCFHSQINVDVRAGNEWVTVGSASGLLNHIAASGADNRCAPSCDARSALLNSRSPAIPRPPVDANGIPIFTASIDRDNVLAMRNPMFSFLVWNGTSSTGDAVPTRDMQWQFALRGQFTPYNVNSGSTTTTSWSPQSMLYITTLGQLALVDGSSQGLVLIDLDTMAQAHAPYF